MSNLPDYYKILGVKPNAKLTEIKKAYRDLAKKYHPDIDGSKEARDKFDEIQKAYEVLEDDKTRKRYDVDSSLEKKRGKAKKKYYKGPPKGNDKSESDYDPTAGYGKKQKPKAPPTKPKKEQQELEFEKHYEGFLRNLIHMDYREKGGIDDKKRKRLEDDKNSDYRGRWGRIKRGMSNLKQELELMDIQLAYLKVLYEHAKIMGSDSRFNPYRELHEEPSNLGYYAKKISEYKKKNKLHASKPKETEAKKKKSFWNIFSGDD